MSGFNRDILKGFSKPCDKHRAKPFWCWNGDLEEHKLKAQIRELKQMGISGALVHSRSGLVTEYLGEKWFDLVNAVCEEAAANDFTIWIYDEDRWPSGTAGGKVTTNPAYRQKRLVMKTFKPEDFTFYDGLLAVFKAKFDNNKISKFDRIFSEQDIMGADKGFVILAFEMTVMPCTDWYNGGAYLDTLDIASVKAFIDSTHNLYLEKCGKYFGNVITSIFTDEPHHESVLAPTIFSVQNNSSDNSHNREIPWTTTLPEFFVEKYGYDILEYLPLIIFDTPDAAANKHRHNYHDCITSMFTTAYAQQLSNWAKRHNLVDTGHVFWESPLNKMVSYVGSVMRYMEHAGMPGVDILSTSAVFTDGRDEYDSVKQCTSIANQFGKEQVMSETYACCGWEFTPEDMKRIGDWQAVLGVNSRCQSCFAYTTTHDGKRDFPPSYFHIPWKEMFLNIEDYYARVNAFISIGKPVRNLLVIHPNETMWQCIKADWTTTEEYKTVEQSYTDLLQWLLGSQIDFDYGDEDILARNADIASNGQKSQIKVAEAYYDCVIVPDLLTIRKTTLQLLKNFAHNGGKVIFSGQIPSYIDGEKSLEAAVFAKTCTTVRHAQADIITALAEIKDIQITSVDANTDTSDMLCTCRQEQDNKYIIVHSTNRDRIQNLMLNINAGLEHTVVYEANPAAGNIQPVNSAALSDGSLSFSLEPLELKLFIVTKAQQAVSAIAPDYQLITTDTLKDADIKFCSPNTCLLDFADYSVDNGVWSRDYLHNADIQIRKSMDWAQRRFNMLQPWADKDWHGTKSVNVKLKYNVRFEFVPSQLAIAMEKPQRFTIKLNGVLAANTGDECFIDHSMTKIPLDTHLIKEGDNTIEMSLDYRKSDGLENIYLLGDFDVSVSADGMVISKPAKICQYCDFTENGKPFYYGTVQYSYTVNSPAHAKAILSVKNWKGACCKVKVNNKEAGYIAFKPYELDITELINSGENKLELTLFSTSRNIFGPFHCSKPFRGKGWTDPRDYFCPNFSEDIKYSLIPLGISEPPIISYLSILM